MRFIKVEHLSPDRAHENESDTGPSCKIFFKSESVKNGIRNGSFVTQMFVSISSVLNFARSTKLKTLIKHKIEYRERKKVYLLYHFVSTWLLYGAKIDHSMFSLRKRKMGY